MQFGTPDTGRSSSTFQSDGMYLIPRNSPQAKVMRISLMRRLEDEATRDCGQETACSSSFAALAAMNEQASRQKTQKRAVFDISGRPSY